MIALLLAVPSFAEPNLADRNALDDDPWFVEGRAAVAKRRAMPETEQLAHNVIVFLGDGMGVSTVTAARILEGQQRGVPGEEGALSFESFPVVGLVKVYNTNQQVPDSAGTMTAIMSGVKTKAGMLGVGANVVPGDHRSVPASHVPTLLEHAEDRGLATGIITTARMTHATPAACYAHAPSRGWEHDALLSPEALKDDFPDLARQLIEFDHGDGIDIMLGGGRRSFLGANQKDPEHAELTGMRWDERDLLREWREAAPGRATPWNAAQLSDLAGSETSQVLGLFEADHMAFEYDRAGDPGGEPSLARMTEFALRRLGRSAEGFVLVVEGGRIDHAHHANNAQRALGETLEFARAIEIATAMTDPAETLIVVTADHGHPFTMAGYAARGNPILGLVHENMFFEEGRNEAPAVGGNGRSYTTLQYAIGPGHHAPTDVQGEGSKQFPHAPLEVKAPTQPSRPNLSDADALDPNLLQHAAVPRFSGVHSGEDVGVWASGPGARFFSGSLEQSALFHGMIAALGWDAPESAQETSAPADDAAPNE